MDRLNYMTVLDLDHHRIHEGNLFTTVDFDAAVAIDTPKYWHFKAPDLPLIHFFYTVFAARSGTVEMFRNPTLGDDGTPIAIDNNNQNALLVPTLLAYTDPTVTDDGVLVGGQVIGSDAPAPNNKGGAGGDMVRSRERILKRRKSYLVKFTATQDDTRVSICVEHYEQVES